ncbi:hypothetical protein ACFLTB_02045 [Chloroflexota bacterium]
MKAFYPATKDAPIAATIRGSSATGVLIPVVTDKYIIIINLNTIVAINTVNIIV